MVVYIEIDNLSIDIALSDKYRKSMKNIWIDRVIWSPKNVDRDMKEWLKWVELRIWFSFFQIPVEIV